ncbi:DUF2382 domain-containing protein [Mobilicoccus pelagius]|uniref:DUF2382 domain-containing protein n=1 Tax=Mobilicoccus pelagius NBRC 104925 TaxID=1089455 RepID=H5UTI2_9MICO|nr:PRC and DUF2382 domain-containing protein [Mobilicoccus pelagius]GAB49040.1 hypothetical protein MOPEL_096_00470 [Mobilicoccus pelagius NBRC 104925]
MFDQNTTQEDISRLSNAEVIDQNGDKVGGVGQIYLDDQTSRPTWVTVKTGLFGTKETFVPLDQATREGDAIRVPYTKDFIKDAPKMEADHHISESEEEELYRYYNLDRGYNDTDVNRRDADVDRRDAVAGEVREDRADLRDREDHTDDGSVVRREEELRVGKERVGAGRVHLRKHVVTDTETVEVPVEREEVHVVREPVRDGEVGGRIGGDENVSVELHEERPVVEKETVAKERVGLEKETHRDTEQVSAEVRKEQVEVEREGDVRRDDASRDDTRR